MRYDGVEKMASFRVVYDGRRKVMRYRVERFVPTQFSNWEDCPGLASRSREKAVRRAQAAQDYEDAYADNKPRVIWYRGEYVDA